MNEFKITDVPEIKSPDSEIFSMKKPESSMSVKDAREFWDNRFKGGEESDVGDKGNLEQEVVDGKVQYYDDNGNLYRIDKDLLPNCEYVVNNYEYKTDEMGRIISAGGKLRLKEEQKYEPIKDSIQDIGKGSERMTDDRGHLIGSRFDGGDGLENAVPQDAKINRGDYNAFEGTLAKAVEEGKDVKIKVIPIYEGDSRRPTTIGVTYSINGELNIRIFPNSRGKE
ncbi:DNA/RNA non-specific endonuclease [Acetatifactor aquisgranensis]|uniref:DNA/RNA non-specific endonuclease n=1 Tax=Acetatifactor aquisgranensis TaxID=2941233 RepID=UPI00203F016F|nr:DNA/RNA non-specific endonuclease [Acetatifactor aquisgranensis]